MTIHPDGTPLRQVVVAGATGLVGQELLRQLDQRGDVAVTAMVRRPGALGSFRGRVREWVVDFEDPAGLDPLGREIPCQVLLCALGTTLRKAGSPQAFRRVDLDYPVAIFRRLRDLETRPTVGVVSAAGAGHPRGLYLTTKAEMERRLLDTGLPAVIARPSLLMGDRAEFRLGERLALALAGRPLLFVAKYLAPQSKLLWRFAPVEAADVAASLIRACVDQPGSPTGRVISGLALRHPILI
jgi:uncharacterized protein YbjT (DUF2867 family)